MEGIWGPDRRRLWWPVVLCSAGNLLFLALTLVLVSSKEFYYALLGLLLLGMEAFCLFQVIWIWRQPANVRTGPVGISISTWRGQHSLRWQDIRAVNRFDLDNPSLFNPLPRLILFGPQRVVILLAGYPRVRQEELFHLIVSRAQLLPDPRKRSWWYAIGYRQ